MIWVWKTVVTWGSPKTPPKSRWSHCSDWRAAACYSVSRVFCSSCLMVAQLPSCHFEPPGSCRFSMQVTSPVEIRFCRGSAKPLPAMTEAFDIFHYSICLCIYILYVNIYVFVYIHCFMLVLFIYLYNMNNTRMYVYVCILYIYIYPKRPPYDLPFLKYFNDLHLMHR